MGAPTGRTNIKAIRVLPAAALACAASRAQAQAIDEPAPTHWRFGVQVGTVQDHDNTEPAAQVTLRDEIDRRFAVEALGNVSLLFMRTGTSPAGSRAWASSSSRPRWAGVASSHPPPRPG